MPGEAEFRSTARNKDPARRIAELASRQGGRITAAQLRRCGLSRATISRWTARGWLHHLDHGLYAVGHVRTDPESELAGALLRAGPGSALSHPTGAWWWELLRFPPRQIHVSAPGTRPSKPGLRIHHPARIERVWHRGLPVTSVTQTLVAIAPMTSMPALRRAVAVADHRNLLDRDAVERELRVHPRGAVRLRHTLENHLPRLAETLSPLEDRFLLLCERYGIPLPEVNAEVGGYTVDALWEEAGLAVELDGRGEHGTPAAVLLDRGRELALRAAGLDVIRYTGEQVDHTPDATADDLEAALARGGHRRRRGS